MRPRIYEIRDNFRELLSSDPRIRNRLLAVLILLAFLAFLVSFNIQQGFAGAEEGRSRLFLFLAININIVLLAVVFYLIARNLLKLAYERRQHVLGVNLKTKLIIAFIILSLPAMGFHLFASIFIANTLESWLQGQHESVLNSARNISEVYHRELRKTMELKGWVWEQQLLRNKGKMPDSSFYRDVDVNVTLYSVDRDIIYQKLIDETSRAFWKAPSMSEWYRIELQDQTWLVEELPDRFIYRHLRRVQSRNRLVFVEIYQPAPRHVTSAINEIAEVELNSLLLSESRELVQRYFLVIFLLMLLFIVFVATWIAFYLAEGFVHPIEDLAVATERVAEGELGYQVQPRGSLDKDFSLLVQSFNAMSRDLRENRLALIRTTEHLQRSNRVLEEHTRFVELVLENITTGVISMDKDGRVEGINRSAKELLQLQTENFSGKHYSEVLTKESLRVFEEMSEKISENNLTSVSQNLTLVKQDSPIQVSATLLMLKNRAGGPVGMVSIYNNITEMQRLQRARAWREVARRIAHEIKNPLTPIQLSAERIRRKYTPQVEDQEALIQSTQTIINEVQQLKRMVSEFSKFAKIPESNPQPVDLNSVIEEALQLYRDNMPSRIQLKTDLAQDIPPVSLDREQMKRMFINLVDNAIDAIEKKGRISRIFRQGEITVRTAFLPELSIAQVDIIDNGTGIDPEMSVQLFEPYSTTKDHGTGLGLTIASQTVTDHQGFVRFSNREEGGAVFTIELPVS